LGQLYREARTATLTWPTADPGIGDRRQKGPPGGTSRGRPDWTARRWPLPGGGRRRKRTTRARCRRWRRHRRLLGSQREL